MAPLSYPDCPLSQQRRRARLAAGAGRIVVFCLLIARLGASGAAAAADQLQVRAWREGAAVAIDARAIVRASLPVIWSTITDYNHLAYFIPGMSTSRVVERHGTEAIVEQQGEMRCLFMRFPIDVVIAADEHYPSAIDARTLKGNLKLSSAGYTLERSAGVEGFALHWFGLVEPQFWIPLFVTVPILRGSVEDQFRAMIDEIERRETARSGTSYRAEGTRG